MSSGALHRLTSRHPRALVALGLLAVAGCDRPAEIHEIEEFSYRWEGDSAFSTTREVYDAVPGQRGRQAALVCFTTPPVDASDPVAWIDNREGLVRSTVDGHEEAILRGSAVIPLPSGSPHEICLEFRAWYPIRMTSIFVGSGRAIAYWTQREEVGSFGVGVLLFGGGLLLLLASLRGPRIRAFRYVALFGLSSGALSLAVTANLRELLFDGEAWRWIKGVALLTQPLGIALLARELFGDTQRNAILRLSGLLCAATVGALALDVLQLYPIAYSRRVVYLFIPLFVATTTFVMREHLRRRDRAARLFLAAALGLIVIALPDMAVGIGLSSYYWGTAKYGLLLFVVALGAIIEIRYADQRTALAAASRELERRVVDLEARGREVDGLNAELRQQLERRSRELRELLSGAAALGTPRLGDGSVVDGRYRVVEALGKGAMGQVFEVERIRDGARLAMKVMLGPPRSDLAARFALEAEVAARVRHPNVVSLVDVGLASEGFMFFVMELVRGSSLEEKRNRFGDRPWALAILRDIAKGLEALHAAGIVHRDLKPSNVLLQGGDAEPTARIADFGVARDVEDLDKQTLSPPDLAPIAEQDTEVAKGITAPGALVGTPLYMPPEFARGLVSPAGDVFSLGIVAHELLTGQRPFKTPSVLAAMAGWVEPPALTVPPGALHDLLERMLEARPEARPSATDVRTALERID